MQIRKRHEALFTSQSYSTEPEINGSTKDSTFKAEDQPEAYKVILFVRFWIQKSDGGFGLPKKILHKCRTTARQEARTTLYKSPAAYGVCPIVSNLRHP